MNLNEIDNEAGDEEKNAQWDDDSSHYSRHNTTTTGVLEIRRKEWFVVRF